MKLNTFNQQHSATIFPVLQHIYIDEGSSMANLKRK